MSFNVLRQLNFAKKTIEKNVHFAETIREYKNAVKKNLKIVKHANAVILQNQSQFQSQSQKLTFRSRQRMIKAKNDNACAKSCMTEKIVNTLLNLSNHRIENAISKKENE
jgi:CRISPR/Cas system CMR subunit Cmr6 (Cas7 group RAMP superfamily)